MLLLLFCLLHLLGCVPYPSLARTKFEIQNNRMIFRAREKVVRWMILQQKDQICSHGRSGKEMVVPYGILTTTKL